MPTWLIVMIVLALIGVLLFWADRVTRRRSGGTVIDGDRHRETPGDSGSSFG
jgi:hypothetical protein